MKVEIDPEDTKTVQLDGRGRGCLGAEYANDKVDVIIIATDE